jgi:hypothetical protein
MRARIEPGKLRAIVERAVAEVASPVVGVMTEQVECFTPARPQPTHRYEAVV